MAREDEFSVQVRQDEGGAVLDVGGEVDITARDLLLEAIDGARRDGEAVVLDLEDVTFIDSGGLQGLLQAHATQREAGSQLVLRRPSPPVLRILEMTGIAAALTIEPDGTAPA